MEATQEKEEVYVDVYGVEYRKIRSVIEKPDGKEKVLIAPNLEGDVPWYVVDKNAFEINFKRE